MKTELDLRPYQQRAVEYILNKRRCGLNLGMGLGKTISALTAFSRIRNIEVKKVLVIAPLNTAKSTWHNELLDWEHTKHLTYSIVWGNEKERHEALKKEVDVYITNQENVVWMFKNKYSKFGMIIVDESTGFKSHAANRFNALKKFKSKYMILLSGTPMPNGEIDMWAQQYLIDHGVMLGDGICKYRSAFFEHNEYTHRYICKYPELIASRLSANWLSMKSEDYIDLPDKIMNIVPVEIDNIHLYKKFEKEYYMKIEDEELTAANAAVLYSKLLQYCNGAIYNEDGEYIEIHNNKLDMMEEIINNCPDENVLVAFKFRSDEERIRKRFNHAITINSKNIEEVKEKWNKREIKLLLCNSASAKGLNIQYGGRIIIWFGLDINAENYLQFNDRLHRHGQTKPVIIYHLVAKNCKDEQLMKALDQKIVSQDNLFRIMREKNASVLK